MIRPAFLRPRYWARYREIARVLAKHGFGLLLDQLGLHRRVGLPRWVLHRKPGQTSLTLAEHLRLALEELGPTFIKMGQVMSTRPDLFPPVYIHELAKLRDSVPPAPWEAIRAVIEEELGGPLDMFFTSFEIEPTAAASLGQVHYATLPTGEDVVVKVQRPGISSIIDTDLDILADLAHLAQERIPRAYDLPEIVEEFAFTLRNELDYQREGRNADRFRVNFADEPHLYIPRVYWDYSTSRVLTLERIRGIKIDDIEALDAAGIDRHQVALNSARIIIKEVLIDGFFHADPHPGNFYVMDDGVIGAMDFGMVGYLGQSDRDILIRLYTVSIELDSREVVNQLVRMGATGPQVDRAGLQRDVERILSKYQNLPLKEIRAGEVMDDAMPIVFRHQLRLPSRLWLLGKTLAMMEGVGVQLDPDFNIFEVSRPYVRSFIRRTLSPRLWGRRLTRALDDWGELFYLLPQQTSQILSQMEQGEIEFTLHLKEGKEFLTRLDRSVNRLTVSVLVAALIVGLALLIPAFRLGEQRGLGFWLVIACFALASVLGMWLLYSMWRPGRHLK